MFRPLALWIGLRYTRAKRSSHFISVVSLFSMLGIALGVMVLIVVLSVMNGFDDEIQLRFFSMAPHMSVTAYSGKIDDWQALQGKITRTVAVAQVTPFVSGEGLLSHAGANRPVLISGILPDQEHRSSAIAEKMIAGRLQDLKRSGFGIILGVDLAARLGVQVGDKVTALIPKVTISIAGVEAQTKRFKVVGLFRAGRGFGFDDKLALIHMQDAQKLFILGQGITGLRLSLQDVYDAPRLTQQLLQTLPPDYYVGNWTDQYGAFFKAVKLEKTMMFFILMLIIAVAAFNLISSLVMIVNDKRAEIAILRTIGAMPHTILSIFMIQGLFVGLVGTTLGLMSGLVIASNATEIVNWIQQKLQLQLVSSSVYFVDYLPSKIQMSDVVTICACALALSFLATIYPAWRAARTRPAQALRYE